MPRKNKINLKRYTHKSHQTVTKDKNPAVYLCCSPTLEHETCSEEWWICFSSITPLEDTNFLLPEGISGKELGEWWDLVSSSHFSVPGFCPA